MTEHEYSETKNIKVVFTKEMQELVEKEMHRTGKTFSSIVRECIKKSIKK